nr:MspA family porin [Rhodococcus wratislaviensis]
MTNISTSRFGYKRFTRSVAVAGIAALAMVMGNGTASAGVDNSSSVIDARGNRIEVVQGDTQYQVVPPLDGVPTSVEFFHNGYAGVAITGPNAEEFKGTQLTVGYQIGYPVSLAGATIVLNSPGLGFAIGSSNGINVDFGPMGMLTGFGLNAGTNAELAGDIIPSQELDIDLEPGGITTVPLLEGQEFDGSAAVVRMQGVHGSISGAIGPVTIRPYAMAVTENGDTVMTYGVPQKLN